MMCKRAGACGTACIQFQCAVFTSVSLLRRQPPGTSLNGLKGLSGFNDASERACVLFLHSNIQRDFAMPLGKSEHYEYFGI